MIEVYNTESIPHGLPVVFLAGPTPRSPDVVSWRPEALRLLEAQGFTGAVVIPENRGFGGRPDFDYAGQIEWERACLAKADVVLFWVPRDMQDMPAFTTNIEFGFVSERGQAYALGYPADAAKMKYLDHVARAQNRPVAHSLADTIRQSLALIGPASQPQKTPAPKP